MHTKTFIGKDTVCKTLAKIKINNNNLLSTVQNITFNVKLRIQSKIINSGLS